VPASDDRRTRNKAALILATTAVAAPVLPQDARIEPASQISDHDFAQSSGGALPYTQGGMNAMLAEVFAPYMKSKNCHWSGLHFREYHHLLAGHHRQVCGLIDELGDISTASLIENWIDSGRSCGPLSKRPCPIQVGAAPPPKDMKRQTSAVPFRRLS